MSARAILRRIVRAQNLTGLHIQLRVARRQPGGAEVLRQCHRRLSFSSRHRLHFLPLPPSSSSSLLRAASAVVSAPPAAAPNRVSIFAFAAAPFAPGRAPWALGRGLNQSQKFAPSLSCTSSARSSRHFVARRGS